jgi:hypothetical protein
MGIAVMLGVAIEEAGDGGGGGGRGRGGTEALRHCWQGTRQTFQGCLGHRATVDSGEAGTTE